MTRVYVVLLLLAALSFLLSVNSTARTKYNVVAFGLFCWVLVPLIQTLRVM